MQAISSYFFNEPERPVEKPKTDCLNRALNGSIAAITSVALYALSLGAVFVTGIFAVTVTGIVFPGASLLLLYGSTLLATFSVGRVSKPFFEKAIGSSQNEKEEVVEGDYVKAVGCFAVGVITSLGLWALSVAGSVFAVGLTARLICGRAVGVGTQRLLWVFLAAPIAGSYLSIFAIHQVAGIHFQKAKAHAFASKT